MTETQWLTSEDPAAMLRWLTASPECVGSLAKFSGVIRDRKLRLFACACCRHQGECVPNGATAVEVAERSADGIEPTDAEKIQHGNWTHTSVGLQHMLRFVVGHRAADSATQADLLREIVGNVFLPVTLPLGGYKAHPSIPTVTVLPCPWLTPTVLTIARTIYDERRWAECGVLADTLSDAGCADEEILRHLRGEERCFKCGGTGFSGDAVGILGSRIFCIACQSTGWRPLRCQHVRGCWALDLILSKE